VEIIKYGVGPIKSGHFYSISVKCKEYFQMSVSLALILGQMLGKNIGKRYSTYLNEIFFPLKVPPREIVVFFSIY